MDPHDDLPAIFAAVVATRPTQPLLTYYDDATGERTELSGATLGNWVAKTANLLVDGCGLAPGDTAAVLLPPHWQTAAVLIGAWSAGVSVTDGPADAAFVAADRLGEAPPADTRFALGLAPMAMPLRPVPPGFDDYITEVRGHGDHFRPTTPAPDDPGPAARRLAASLELQPDDRLLIDAAAGGDPARWLYAPLAAGASIVLCANLEPDRVPARVAAERVTRVLD